MQGERASIGSISEAFNFELDSTSNNAVIDQPIRWDNGLQDYMFLAAADTNPTLANSVNHEQRKLHRFNIGEASTSHNERWKEIVRFEEQRNGKLELNPLFAQPSNGNNRAVVRNVNLNAEYNEHVEDMNPVIGHPGLLRSRIIPENSVRVNGGRVSRKRKAPDASIGQSSTSGGLREVQRGECSSWISPPAYYNQAMATNHVNLSLDHGRRGLVSNAVPNVAAPVITESSSRNHSVRANNPTHHQQETVSPSVFVAGSVIRRPVAPSSNHPLPGLLPEDPQLLNLRYAHALANFNSQNPNAPAPHMPPVSRNVFNWNAIPVAAAVSSSSATPVETRQTSNSLHVPLFVPVPELRHVAHGHISRNASGATHVASSSSSANLQRWQLPTPSPSPSNPAWNPYQNNNSPHNQGSLSEQRRSLLSSLSSRIAAARSSVPPATPPVGHVVQSGGENTSQVHTWASSRTGVRQRQHAATGVPHSTSRGRSRTGSSEIRNVLAQMRMQRGGNLRIEDVMLLNQSMMMRGMAGIHDRHRDMRLDVDNMTYEELLSLEERIGDVCTGLNEETISNRLKQHKYKSSTGAPQEVEPCCICQEEYNEGEELGVLECGHNFHSHCIKEWLKLKNLCPICKTTGLNTANKRRRR